MTYTNVGSFPRRFWHKLTGQHMDASSFWSPANFEYDKVAASFNDNVQMIKQCYLLDSLCPRSAISDKTNATMLSKLFTLTDKWGKFASPTLISAFKNFRVDLFRCFQGRKNLKLNLRLVFWKQILCCSVKLKNL